MKIRVENHGYDQHDALFQKKIMQKIPSEFGDEGMLLEFSVDPTIGAEESYEIVSVQQGWKITGTDTLGLYHGIGKFLHTAKWSEQNFEPQPPKGVVTPACSFRAIYFSVHYYNWYHMAPTEELEEYLEDLVLWGYNTIHCIVPVLNIDDIGDEVFVDSVNRARRLFTLARKLGMKTSLGINPNQGLKTAPHEFDNEPSFNLRLRGNAGRNLCPSKPGAVEYLKTIWRAKFEQFTDIGIDFIHTWPYDEGGCGCKDCRPWGANKYCDISITLHEEAMKYYPNAKYIVSTWSFDATEDEGEYAGFYKRLEDDMSWVDYIMVDAHGAYPDFPLEHEVIKPVVNFPEISMWALFPWGGYGANPLPKRFQEIWDSSKRILRGGMPYSEGKYEDILKVQCVAYYWEPDRSYQDIMKEYIGYEYSGEVYEEVLEIMELIEQNHAAVGNNCEPDLSVAVRARELAEAVDARLGERARTSWRWRILYIRTILDEKRYGNYFDRNMNGEEDLHTLRRRSGVLLVDDREAQELFQELCGYYHCIDYNGCNHHTHPPVDGGYQPT